MHCEICLQESVKVVFVSALRVEAERCLSQYLAAHTEDAGFLRHCVCACLLRVSQKDAIYATRIDA